MFKWSDKYKRFCLFLALIVLLQFFVTHSIYAQTVVGNEEIPEDKILFTKPLIGYRKFSPELFSTHLDTHHAPPEEEVEYINKMLKELGMEAEKPSVEAKKSGIPVDIFIESAKATPLVKNKIIKEGKDPSNATIYEWYNASKAANWRIGQEHLRRPIGIPVSSKAHKNAIDVDPSFVASLPETEIFKSDKPSIYTSEVGNNKVEYMEVDPDVYKNFVNSYYLLDTATASSPSMMHQTFNQASSRINSKPFLAAVAKFTAGDVTFGDPKVSSSEEKNLVIPQSITSKADVYWIEFAVSFRSNIDFSSVEKLTFGVSAPGEVLAIELIPLRFDKDMSITQIVSSPDIKIKFGNAEVGLDKFYEQTAVYKLQKPLIVAYGLQESDFSWSMMDDAVQPGAKRFIAILKVPKGKELVTVQLQASVQTKPFAFFQGNLTATEPKLVEILLK